MRFMCDCDMKKSLMFITILFRKCLNSDISPLLTNIDRSGGKIKTFWKMVIFDHFCSIFDLFRPFIRQLYRQSSPENFSQKDREFYVLLDQTFNFSAAQCGNAFFRVTAKSLKKSFFRALFEMKNQKISKKISPDPEKVRNLIRNTLVFEIWKNNHNSESYGQKSEHDQKIENARPALLQTVITREILIWPKFSKKNVKAHKILHLIGTKNEGVQKSAWFHIGPFLW